MAPLWTGLAVTTAAMAERREGIAQGVLKPNQASCCSTPANTNLPRLSTPQVHLLLMRQPGAKPIRLVVEACELVTVTVRKFREFGFLTFSSGREFSLRLSLYGRMQQDDGRRRSRYGGDCSRCLVCYSWVVPL